MPWRLKTFLWCVALLLVFLWGVIAFTLLPLEQGAAPEWGDTVNTVQKAIAGVGIAFAVVGFFGAISPGSARRNERRLTFGCAGFVVAFMVWAAWFFSLFS